MHFVPKARAFAPKLHVEHSHTHAHAYAVQIRTHMRTRTPFKYVRAYLGCFSHALARNYRISAAT